MRSTKVLKHMEPD